MAQALSNIYLSFANRLQKWLPIYYSFKIIWALRACLLNVWRKVGPGTKGLPSPSLGTLPPLPRLPWVSQEPTFIMFLFKTQRYVYMRNKKVCLYSSRVTCRPGRVITLIQRYGDFPTWDNFLAYKNYGRRTFLHINRYLISLTNLNWK